MDADRFAKYWGEGTPRMHIPGRTFPVQDVTLEGVLEMTCYIPPKRKLKKKKQSQYFRGDSGGSNPNRSSFEYGDDHGDDADYPAEKDSSSTPDVCMVPLDERLKRMNEDEIDYDLIAVLIRTLLRRKDDDGSILVFLPGAGEIERAERAIRQIVKGFKLTVLPLHGGLQTEKQQLVFLPAQKGWTKVILSTNVAETSITIPDCTIVVDTCKEKQSSFDPINRMPLLLERFASRDSLKQRRGRAGRVGPGTCFKLISSSFHDQLPEHGEPEIKRCALDQTLLSLIYIGLENGSGDFMSSVLDPPSRQSIDSALHFLEKTGALYRDGDIAILTPLGMHLAGIPTPPAVGKMLVMGCLLGCRDMSLAIAAGMSVGRNPFLRIDSFNNGISHIDGEVEQKNPRRIIEERLALFKMVGNSDHVMLGKAFLMWRDINGASEKKRFCDRLGLAFNGMRDMLGLTSQFDSSLSSLGFLPSTACNRNEKSWRIVRSLVVASLSPTQVIRVQRPSTKYTEVRQIIYGYFRHLLFNAT
jgi:ATP-dependent RNA helicase DHX57